MHIDTQPESSVDHGAIRDVVRAAFDHHQEVPDLVDLIRASPEFVPELSLVARHDGEVVGHVMLSHAELVDELGERRGIFTLSPLAVAPAVQRRGIGSALVPAAWRPQMPSANDWWCSRAVPATTRGSAFVTAA